MRGLLAVAAMLLVGVARADQGGMISGGGAILRDAGNPWFMGDVETVRYCIARDAEHVSASEALIDRQVQAAVEYWRDQFAHAQYDRHEEKLRQARQRFVKGTCPARLEEANEQFDVVFQFGVSTQAQRDYLRDPAKFIGVAVRTAYDERTLNGKGFLYFSADSGPWRYQGEEFFDDAWSVNDGGPLLHVLIHELGHVFGLPHTGGQFDVMGEGYPAFVVTRFEGMGEAMSANTKSNVFKPLEQFNWGMSADEVFCTPAHLQWALRPLLRWLYLDPSVPCLRLRIKGGRFEAHYRRSADGPLLLAGVAPLNDDAHHKFDEDVYLGGLAVTPAQQVIDDVGTIGRMIGYVAGPKVVTRHRTGLYRDEASGALRQLILRQTPREMRVGGIDEDGQVVFDVYRMLRPEDVPQP